MLELTEQQLQIYAGKLCPYCLVPSKHVSSNEVYGSDYGMLYVCAQCNAYVGCHKKKPEIALGRLADAELREWKKKAHAMFDPIWRDGHMDRSDAYQWLSEQMELPKEFTHIGMFNVKSCKKVVIFSGMYFDKLMELTTNKQSY